MPRSSHGGRHELGQNFLTHRPTIDRIVGLVAATNGPILEIGAGDGALTRSLIELGRPLTAIDIDEHRVARLQRLLPTARIEQADVLRHPLTAPVIVGNIPFHITTPILRRLLTKGTWQQTFLLTQWEVARKRAGVGGSTMMTAQTAPWFTFTLHDRVPSWCFRPRPSVDGGILGISRRGSPLVPSSERATYERFVQAVFTGRGGKMERIIQGATRLNAADTRRALAQANVDQRSLPRDLDATQWATLWEATGR
jgi:23S rRNA (adenine-N6)-dimethyltransferase